MGALTMCGSKAKCRLLRLFARKRLFRGRKTGFYVVRGDCERGVLLKGLLDKQKLDLEEEVTRLAKKDDLISLLHPRTQNLPGPDAGAESSSSKSKSNKVNFVFAEGVKFPVPQFSGGSDVGPIVDRLVVAPRVVACLSTLPAWWRTQRTTVFVVDLAQAYL